MTPPSTANLQHGDILATVDALTAEIEFLAGAIASVANAKQPSASYVDLKARYESRRDSLVRVRDWLAFHQTEGNA